MMGILSSISYSTNTALTFENVCRMVSELLDDYEVTYYGFSAVDVRDMSAKDRVINQFSVKLVRRGDASDNAAEIHIHMNTIKFTNFKPMDAVNLFNMLEGIL